VKCDVLRARVSPSGPVDRLTHSQPSTGPTALPLSRTQQPFPHRKVLQPSAATLASTPERNNGSSLRPPSSSQDHVKRVPNCKRARSRKRILTHSKYHRPD
jgi:hypothetical protein